MLDIELQWAIDELPLPTQRQCEQWVSAALVDRQKNQAVEMTIRIVDLQESQQLNGDYRNKDKPTNVLSFEFEQPPGLADLGEALPYLGDLAICAEVVALEAAAQHKTVESHWAHMIVHGTLHLQGYDHINDDDAEMMEGLEIKIMQGLGFANPYESAS